MRHLLSCVTAGKFQHMDNCPTFFLNSLEDTRLICTCGASRTALISLCILEVLDIKWAVMFSDVSAFMCLDSQGG
jgi:hypothetical protein